ncbi:MAG: hypothetical protein ACR2ME_01755 [Acidimicrobiia bacterium]
MHYWRSKPIFVDTAWALSSGGEAGAALSTGIKVGPNTLGEILCGLSPGGSRGSTRAQRGGGGAVRERYYGAPSSGSFVGGHSPAFRQGRGSNIDLLGCDCAVSRMSPAGEVV